jgi:hypothetical protein
MTRTSLRLCFITILVALLTVRSTGSDVERLATLARVWAAVKFLHPYMLQKEIDWDAALVRAIPAVRAAATDDDFARAVGSMLGELGDPATHVLQSAPRAQSGADATLYQWAGDTLVINAGPYAAAKSGMALYGERASLLKEIAKAKQVLFDVRHHTTNADERGIVAFAVSELTGLTADVASAPAGLYVHHSGYRPQQGTSSGGYYSGFLTVPGQTFGPAAPGTLARRVRHRRSIDPSLARGGAPRRGQGSDCFRCGARR